MIFDVDEAAYDRFMGRYSTPLAPLFADFAGVGAGQRVLDVGAGPGALTDVLAARVGAENVAAAEPSAEFVAVLRRRFPGIEARQAVGEELPWPDGSFDAALAQLVISFVADPVETAAEMMRVVRRGGTVALCMWLEDGMDLSPPLRAARAAAGVAPPPRPSASWDERSFRRLLEGAGLEQVETALLEVTSEYAGFDEFWSVALAMRGGPATAWMEEVDEERLAAARAAAARTLAAPAGSFVLRGRAAAARGVRAD